MFHMRSIFQVVVFSISLAACSNATQDIAASEQKLIDNPSPEILAEVEEILQERLSRQTKLEAHILATGRSLTELEIKLARAVGVKHPSRIRILEVAHIPLRDTDQKLISGEAIKKPPFRMAVIGGLQAGYGLVIDKRYLKETWLLAHEFAHIHQFEKLGQERMLRQVLIEHQVLDGKLIPIEREAIALSEAATGIKAPNYH